MSDNKTKSKETKTKETKDLKYLVFSSIENKNECKGIIQATITYDAATKQHEGSERLTNAFNILFKDCVRLFWAYVPERKNAYQMLTPTSTSTLLVGKKNKTIYQWEREQTWQNYKPTYKEDTFKGAVLLKYKTEEKEKFGFKHYVGLLCHLSGKYLTQELPKTHVVKNALQYTKIRVDVEYQAEVVPYDNKLINIDIAKYNGSIYRSFVYGFGGAGVLGWALMKFLIKFSKDSEFRRIVNNGDILNTPAAEMLQRRLQQYEQTVKRQQQSARVRSGVDRFNRSRGRNRRLR